MSLLLWDEVTALWQAGEYRAVHDWLNERWARTVQESPRGDADPFAQFFQGPAFAALALHFAAEQNGESAALFVEDGLERLPRYAPAFAGIEVTPLNDSLAELRDLLPSPPGGGPIPPLVSGARALRFAAGRLS